MSVAANVLIATREEVWRGEKVERSAPTPYERRQQAALGFMDGLHLTGSPFVYFEQMMGPDETVWEHAMLFVDKHGDQTLAVFADCVCPNGADTVRLALLRRKWGSIGIPVQVMACWCRECGPTPK